MADFDGGVVAITKPLPYSLKAEKKAMRDDNFPDRLRAGAVTVVDAVSTLETFVR